MPPVTQVSPMRKILGVVSTPPPHSRYVQTKFTWDWDRELRYAARVGARDVCQGGVASNEKPSEKCGQVTAGSRSRRPQRGSLTGAQCAVTVMNAAGIMRGARVIPSERRDRAMSRADLDWVRPKPNLVAGHPSGWPGVRFLLWLPEAPHSNDGRRRVNYRRAVPTRRLRVWPGWPACDDGVSGLDGRRAMTACLAWMAGV